MNLRTTIILFGVLILGLGGFFLFQVLGILTPEERKERAKWVLPSLHDRLEPVKDEAVSRIILERHQRESGKTEKVEFERKGDDWRMIAPKNVRTDSPAVNRLLDQLMSAERKPYLALESSLSEYGLDKPDLKATLHHGDKTSVITVGDTDPGDDPSVYVVSSDYPDEPMVIAKSRIDKVFAEVAEFRSKDLLKTGTTDITSVRLTGTERQGVELEKDEDKEWVFKEPKLGDGDTAAIDELVRNITNLRIAGNDDFIADGDVDWAKYGLAEDKAAFAVTITRKPPGDKPPESETLLIGGKDDSSEAVFRSIDTVGASLFAGSPPMVSGSLVALTGSRSPLAELDIGGYYARVPGENSVIRLDAKHKDLFAKKADELRSKKVVKIDATKADAINIQAAGDTLRFRRPELKTADNKPAAAEWFLYTGVREKVKTHLNVVPELIDAINKIELKDAKAFLDDGDKQREWFGDKPVDLGFDKPQAEVAIWLEGIKRNENGMPTSDGEPQLKDDVKETPSVRLTVGRKDDERSVVYVKRQIGDNPAAILAVPDPFVAKAQGVGAQQSMSNQPKGESISLSRRVTAGYLAFRDHTLPSFKTNEAVKIEFSRHGVTYVLEKVEEKDDMDVATKVWKLKQPVEGKASKTVEMLLSNLAALTPERLVTDKAPESDFKDKYGLAADAFIKATVTVHDENKRPSEYTYVIGGLTDPEGKEPNRFYGRIRVKPYEGALPEANGFVFLLPWTTTQSIDLELRDTEVFAQEQDAKPKEVTFTWRTLAEDKSLKETKLTVTRGVEKKMENGEPRTENGEQWAVKELTVNGQDAKSELPTLDNDKLDQLFGTTPLLSLTGPKLNPLVTERFVVHNGEPQPEHQLDPANADAPPALVIDIKYDNDGVRSLTLGSVFEPKEEEYPGLKSAKFYYATASTLPNAVFLLGESAFKELAAGVEYFKAK